MNIYPSDINNIKILNDRINPSVSAFIPSSSQSSLDEGFVTLKGAYHPNRPLKILKPQTEIPSKEDASEIHNKDLVSVPVNIYRDKSDSKKSKVVIIDDNTNVGFYDKQSGVVSVGHNNLVEKNVVGSNVNKVLIPLDKDKEAFQSYHIAKALRYVASNVNKFTPGAINVSLNSALSYEEINKLSGLQTQITPENIYEHRQEIIAAINDLVKSKCKDLSIDNDLDTIFKRVCEYDKREEALSKELSFGHDRKKHDLYKKLRGEGDQYRELLKYKGILTSFEEINRLKDYNICVLTSAGNETPDLYNTLGLNSNTIMISGRDKNNNRINNWSYNSTVDISLPSIFPVSTNGLEVDLTGDGQGDFPIKQFPEIQKAIQEDPSLINKELYEIKGTSFSLPRLSDITRMMHDKGFTIDQIKTIFKQADGIIEKDKTKNIYQEIYNLIQR